MEPRRTRIPSIAVAESRELARLLIETFDKAGDDHHAGYDEDHDLEVPADGVLDCHELPIRAFHDLDNGCEDGQLDFHELERAFVVLAPAERRRLIDALRDPAERSRHHWHRIGPSLLGAWFLGAGAGVLYIMVGQAWGLAGAAIAAAVFVKGIAHYVATHRAGDEIVRLLNEAL